MSQFQLCIKIEHIIENNKIKKQLLQYDMLIQYGARARLVRLFSSPRVKLSNILCMHAKQSKHASQLVQSIFTNIIKDLTWVCSKSYRAVIHKLSCYQYKNDHAISIKMTTHRMSQFQLYIEIEHTIESNKIKTQLVRDVLIIENNKTKYDVLIQYGV